VTVRQRKDLTKYIGKVVVIGNFEYVYYLLKLVHAVPSLGRYAAWEVIDVSGKKHKPFWRIAMLDMVSITIEQVHPLAKVYGRIAHDVIIGSFNTEESAP
jgi:hypothetical protein